MSQTSLSLVSTPEPDWFHLVDTATDAIRFKLKSNASSGLGGVWDIFERIEAGFCFRGQCVGYKPSEAFLSYMRRRRGDFMVHVRAEF